MREKRLFLEADAAIREVLNSLSPEQLDIPVPSEWTGKEDSTVRDLVAAHTKDEAWVPDVLADRTIEEVGDRWEGELLGNDPIGNYNRYNDAATEAVAADSLPLTVHMSYGDYPVETFFEHTTYYRAFQAWAIARYVGNEFHLPNDLVEGLWTMVEPNLDDLRAIGVFPPEIELPEGASREEQLLAKVGYWLPEKAAADRQ
jgi:uncharacterized protein (TIGR03086 family)